MKQKKVKKSTEEFAKAVGRALLRAGRRAREVARLHGTKIYISRNGKIVGLKP
jgi:hypothetical protein